MSEYAGSREENAINNLSLILNAKPSPVKDTTIFETISHPELCKAVKFWFEQLRLLFGEPINVEIVHGNNEDGIDLYINLLKEPIIRFAIQIKSYGDIKKGNFNDSVYAQIGKSIKHALTRLVFAFAADLTSQDGKISHILSEIHKHNAIKSCLFVLNSAELLTIYNVYKNNLFAVDYLNINFENIFNLTTSIANLLSNERRKVKVSLELKYINNKAFSEGYRISLKHNLSGTDIGILDKQENLKEGESIAIPSKNIEIFEVTKDREEKIFSKKVDEIRLFKTRKIIPISFQALSIESEILSELSNLPFVFEKQTEDKFSFLIQDDAFPIRFKLHYEIIDKGRSSIKMSFSFNLEEHRSDVTTLYKGITFINALSYAKKLKIITEDIESIHENPKIDNAIDSKYLNFVKKLSQIQETTGTILRIPFKPVISQIVITEVNNVIKGITTGKIDNLNLTFKSKGNRIQTLKLLKDIIESKKESIIQQRLTFKIFERQIDLGPGKIIAKQINGTKNLDETYQDLVSSNEEEVELFLKISGDYLLDWFQKNE